MLGTPGPFEYGPIQIEVVSNPWLPYIPALVGFLGSLLVAAVAFYGVHKSNETTRDATDAADKRERDRWEKDTEREHERWENDRQSEREKWHRDNLMRLCSEALRVARDVRQHYVDAAAACLMNSDDLAEAQRSHRERLAAAEAAIDETIPLHYEIDLLGESRVAFELLEFREVAVFTSPAIKGLHEYLVGNFENSGIIRLFENLEWRRYVKAMRHIDAATSDLKTVAQQRISPDSVTKGEPVKIDFILTPEKEPEMFYREATRRNSIFRRASPFDWNAGDTADPPSAGADPGNGPS